MSELPENWIITSLSEVATWGSGGTPSRTNLAYFGGGIPWIKTGELGKPLIERTEETISELGLANSSAKVFPRGSIAIAMYGATIGKVSVLGIDAATNQACAVGIPDQNLTTDEFLYYFLCSQKDPFIEAGKGAAQPNISQAVLKNWLVPLPPLNEQKRIADKLDALLVRVDACRERLDRIPLILKRFRQSVLAAATSGQLTEEWRAENRTSDLSDGINVGLTRFDFADANCFGDYKFPASWRVARLEDIAEIFGGITKDSKKQDPKDEELPYLRVANVQRGFFNLSEIKTMRVPRRRVEAGGTHLNFMLTEYGMLEGNS